MQRLACEKKVVAPRVTLTTVCDQISRDDGLNEWEDFLAERKLALETNNVHLKPNRCCKSVMKEFFLQSFSQLLVQTLFCLQKTAHL